MKKYSIKKRFLYWFDKWMAKGSFGLIRLLAIFTLIVILLVKPTGLLGKKMAEKV